MPSDVSINVRGSDSQCKPEPEAQGVLRKATCTFQQTVEDSMAQRDQAELAPEQMSNDPKWALPNSVRVTRFMSQARARSRGNSDSGNPEEGSRVIIPQGPGPYSHRGGHG